MRYLRPLALRLAGNRRPRQVRGAVLHDEGVFERIPGRGDVGRGRALGAVVAYVIANQVAGDAELHIGVDVRVLRIVKLRDQRLEAGLVDQEMQVRGPHIVPAGGTQQLADRTVDRDRVAGGLYAAKANVSVLVG